MIDAPWKVMLMLLLKNIFRIRKYLDILALLSIYNDNQLNRRDEVAKGVVLPEVSKLND